MSSILSQCEGAGIRRSVLLMKTNRLLGHTGLFKRSADRPLVRKGTDCRDVLQPWPSVARARSKCYAGLAVEGDGQSYQIGFNY